MATKKKARNCAEVPCVLRCRLEEQLEEERDKAKRLELWWKTERSGRIAAEKRISELLYGKGRDGHR